MNTSKIQEKVMPIVNKVTSNKYLKAVSDGIAGVMPVIIVGAIFTLIANFPIGVYQDFIANSGLSSILNIPNTFTNNIL